LTANLYINTGNKDNEIYVGEEAPKDKGWTQDKDVLDTWFSSALWPFSTLGWPNKTADYKRYYPNNVMVTGYDIIFFWVSRMIFQGIEFTGKSPFKECLLHGLIRDESGRKMSKSLGNGVDPTDVINKYGADSLRYFITTNSAPGLDLRYEEEKVESSWNFINKLWNISRYVIMNTKDINIDEINISKDKLNFADKWILTKLNNLIKSTDKFFDRYEFSEVARLIYNFTWHDFASWYLEMTKLSDNKTTKFVLIYVLDKVIKLLHPFMPFVTEEIYQQLPHKEVSIMVDNWPKISNLNFPKALKKAWFFELIKRIRNIRNEYHVAWTKPIDIYIKTSKTNEEFITNNEKYINKFLNPKSLTFSQDTDNIKNAVSIILKDIQVAIPLGSLIDIDEEINKIKNEIIDLQKEIKRCENMLSNENFIKKAPKTKVEEEKNKLEAYKKRLNKAQNRLTELKN
ncbi:MAG: class I tRNA ligase family protein, partial [Bacillota bacterium]